MMKVSLILTSKNEEKFAKKFFQAIKKQTKKPDEIILVDSSADRTAEIAKPFVDKLIKLDHSIGAKYRDAAGLQRNIGIKNSRGDIIVFTDLDAIPHPDWLEELTKPFENPNINVVQGQVFFHSYNGKREKGMFQAGLKEWGKYLNNCNAAFRRKVLKEFPLANDIRWDDVELGYRISKKYIIYGNKKAKVYHYAVNFKERDMWDSAFFSAIGWVRILKRYRKSLYDTTYWFFRIWYNIFCVIKAWGFKTFIYYCIAFFYALCLESYKK